MKLSTCRSLRCLTSVVVGSMLAFGCGDDGSSGDDSAADGGSGVRRPRAGERVDEADHEASDASVQDSSADGPSEVTDAGMAGDDPARSTVGEDEGPQLAGEAGTESAPELDHAGAPAPVPSGSIGFDELPSVGSVGFILAGGEFTFYAVPGSGGTSINHLSVDGRRAYGWYTGDDQQGQAFELDLETGTYDPIVLPDTRFAIVRGGHGSLLVGKLADDSGTPDDPDDDVRKGFVFDTQSGELTTYTRDGYEDIGFSSLNAQGVITGFNDFGTQGFLFVEGEYVDLDDPNAYRLFPFQINDTGRFVGFWGTSEATWYDNAQNPSFVGAFDGEGIASIERYEFPGYSGTGLAGINPAGVMAGIAYPTADSRPVVFTTTAVDALPQVHRLPEHLEPFVVGIDSRRWVYGQILIHELAGVEIDPATTAIKEAVVLIRSYVSQLNGPAHSGPVSGAIHSAFHDVESPLIEMESAMERLGVAAGDRDANAETIRALLVDEMWIEARKLEFELSTMRGLVSSSAGAETDDAARVLESVAGAEVEVAVLKGLVRTMAAEFQEPALVEYTGVGGPLNPKLLDGGNVLVSLLTDDRVVELAPDGSVAWSYAISSPTDAQRLDDGSTLIASTGEGRALELTPQGDVAWEYPGEAIYGVHRLQNGNTLIAIQGEPARIVEVDVEGGVVWQYGAGSPTLLAPSARRLDNGHTLVADNSGYSLGGARVSELDLDDEVIWTYDRDIFGIYGVDRLQNGNTLINDQSNGRVLEVSPAGARVWSYGALSAPGGFQVLPENELLIAVFGENRIVHIAR